MSNQDKSLSIEELIGSTGPIRDTFKEWCKINEFKSNHEMHASAQFTFFSGALMAYNLMIYALRQDPTVAASVTGNMQMDLDRYFKSVEGQAYVPNLKTD